MIALGAVIVTERGSTAVVNSIHIVGAREGISVAGKAKAEEQFAAEEIDAGVNAGRIQLLDPVAKPVEVRLVESRQIKSQLPVRGVARAGPLPGLWSDAEIRRRARRGRQAVERRQLGRPQQREIVVMIDQHLHERRKVQRLNRAVRPPILEGVPGMRARQVDRLAGAVGEVVGIRRERLQRHLDRGRREDLAALTWRR